MTAVGTTKGSRPNGSRLATLRPARRRPLTMNQDTPTTGASSSGNLRTASAEGWASTTTRSTRKPASAKEPIVAPGGPSTKRLSYLDVRLSPGIAHELGVEVAARSAGSGGANG